MANTSIYAAFERMWQHTVAALGNKFDKTGGEITGDLKVNGTVTICDSNSDHHAQIAVDDRNSVRFTYPESVDESIVLSNIGWPSDGADATNKTYVDETFVKIENTKPVIAESTDGINYTVTVPGVAELYTGLSITIIPDKTSESTSPYLNVNGLGEYRLIHRGGVYGTKLEYNIVDGLSWYMPYKLTFYKFNQFDDENGQEYNETLSGWIVEDVYLPSKEYITSAICESGTWIPTLVSGADSLTGFSNGTYHKTGNIVTVSILCWGTFTNRNSDPIVISLPFKVASTRSYGQFGYSNINNATLAHQYVYAGQGNTCCELKYRGSSGQEVALTGTDVGKDNWTFQFSLTYATDE